MRKKLFKKKMVFMFTFIFIFSICFVDGHKVKATEYKPDIKITMSTTKSRALANEEIEIKYRIEPQPIDVNDINKRQDKEIILVVDTSGSMNTKLNFYETRMDALKKAAYNFIEKFKNEKDLKIGIVDYNFSANERLPLTDCREQSELIYAISRLRAGGATNIGDGIRVAANMFSKDKNVKKYLVLMSDGTPTSFSYKGYTGGEAHNKNGKKYHGVYYHKYYGQYYYDYYDDYYYDYDYERYHDYQYYWLPRHLTKSQNWSYYGVNDNDIIKYGTYGTNDPKEYCLEYSKLMAKELKKNSITNYIIGFSKGSDSSKLQEIARSSGGSYYDAKDATAINTVYSEIGNQIKADYAVEEVNFNFNLPEGMECSINNSEIFKQGNNQIESIPNIIYKLNAQKTQYIADPFDIIIKIKCTKSGKYSVGKDWNISYKGIKNNVIIKNLPSLDVTIDKYNFDFDVSRKVSLGIGGNLNINKEFEMNYEIIPKPIPVHISNKAEDFSIDSKLTENLPDDFYIVDSKKSSFSDKIKVNYIYNTQKKQYEAKPIIIKKKIIPRKIGNYYLKDDAEISYVDLEGEKYNKKFNSLNISVIDDYVVKQGLFQRDDSYKGNYPGENNIMYLQDINIIPDNLIRLGAFIRTNGQNTDLSIDINPNKVIGIESLYDLKINVFNVNENGSLENIKPNVRILKNNSGIAKILINLPKQNTKNYSYYIVNYNFKVKTNIDSNINMISRCEILGANRSNTLDMHIGKLPDLF